MICIIVSCNKSNEMVNVPVQYPSTPGYVQPDDNASVVQGTTATFKWSSCSDPQGDPVSYDLIIWGDYIDSYTDLSGTEQPVYVLNDPYPYDYQTIYWKVRAKDNHGNYSDGPARILHLLSYK